MRLSAVDSMNGSSACRWIRCTGTGPQSPAVTSAISHETNSPQAVQLSGISLFGPTNGYCPLLSRLRQCETFPCRRNARSCSLSESRKFRFHGANRHHSTGRGPNSAHADLRCASFKDLDNRPRASAPCSESDHRGHCQHDGILPFVLEPCRPQDLWPGRAKSEASSLSSAEARAVVGGTHRRDRTNIRLRRNPRRLRRGGRQLKK